MRRIRKLLVCVMCVLMLCSFAGCGNNTGTANDNLNDATSGENYDGSGENGNNTGNNAGYPNDDYGISKVIRNILEGDVLAAPESGSLSLRNVLGGTGLYLSYVRM